MTAAGESQLGGGGRSAGDHGELGETAGRGGAGAEVVVALDARTPRAIARELERQTRQPAESFAGPHALQQALAFGAPLIWVLGANASPCADALERLLEQLRPAGEKPPDLLAGMVLGADRTPVAALLPAGDERRAEDVLRLARSRLLPIRNAPLANALARRKLFAEHGLPDRDRYGPYAGVEWSARALRTSSGYFVPASVATVAQRTSRATALAAIPALRRARGAGALTRGEAFAASRRLARVILGRPTARSALSG